MSVSAQRRSSYRQTAPALRFEEYSAAKRFRLEGYERQNNFNRPKPALVNNIGLTVNRTLLENNVISNKDYDLFPSPFTKEIFLEYYAMGKQNLSTIEHPSVLEDISFLKAPEAYYEIRRLNTVEKYMNLPHWNHSNRFNTLLKKMMAMFNCKGASLSLIDSRLQIIKFQYGLGFDQCSRQVSIDSHAILSSGFFLILDASKDWRFKSNPIVKSLPNIKFYLGVPLIAPNKQVVGVLSIFDSFARANIDESTIKIMKKISNEIMEYLDTSIKKRSGDNRDAITGKLLQSTSLPTGSNSRNESSNSNKLLEIYGRATSSNKKNEEIIFEKDGSGTSYKYNTNLKFSKYSCPYDDLIDLSVWKKLSQCDNLRKASNLLCEILLNKLSVDCIYICNVKVTKNCWISKQFYPMTEREIEVENYKYEDKIGWVDGEDEKEEGIMRDFGSMKMKIIGMAARESGVQNRLDSDNVYEFHSKAIRSVNGLNYQSTDSKVIFHSGYSLPFFRHPNKLVRKKKIKTILQSERNDTAELFFKSNGYLITCFDSNGRDISESEIGYVYGCASILRRIFFY